MPSAKDVSAEGKKMVEQLTRILSVGDHILPLCIPFFRTKKQIIKKKLNLDSEGAVHLICKNPLYAHVFIIKNSYWLTLSMHQVLFAVLLKYWLI